MIAEYLPGGPLAFLIAIAWKSALVAGSTLLLLRLLTKRSAGERSWVAHAGLATTLLLPFISFSTPTWEIETPVPIPSILPASADAGHRTLRVDDEPSLKAADLARDLDPGAGSDWLNIPDQAPLLFYAIPALLLLLITVIAILRLVALRRRADVLVEPDWIAALARAQQRMGFKYGTALLVSDDIVSPVSWGVLRPVILLNQAAIKFRGQAEAIIAHELAHVARLDWAKLLLSRIATAVFWFNPLVWRLAGQCHQLREETADDAVLASDISDIAYAELLVGVARHESSALLLAANGVASGRDSLKRRVARVLNTGLRRTPVRWAWSSACIAGALAVAAPLAALSFTNGEQLRVQPASMLSAEIRPALPLPRFEGINLRGGGRVTIRHGAAHSIRFIQGDSETSEVAVVDGALAINSCTGPCRDPDLVAEVTTPSIEALAVRDGGAIEAEGEFPVQRSLAIAVSDGGRVDTRVIGVDEVVAAVKGGGMIATSANRRLITRVSGGGLVKYWGAPDVMSNVSDGGIVTRGDD